MIEMSCCLSKKYKDSVMNIERERLNGLSASKYLKADNELLVQDE